MTVNCHSYIWVYTYTFIFLKSKKYLDHVHLLF